MQIIRLDSGTTYSLNPALIIKN